MIGNVAWFKTLLRSADARQKRQRKRRLIWTSAERERELRHGPPSSPPAASGPSKESKPPSSAALASYSSSWRRYGCSDAPPKAKTGRLGGSHPGGRRFESAK